MNSTSRFTTAALTASLTLLGTAAMAADPVDPVTGTQYKATDDMATVLTTLKGLKGKPIETLSPAEARQQPTVADAVKAVLTAQGKSTDPTSLVPGVTSRDSTIPGPAGALPVRVYAFRHGSVSDRGVLSRRRVGDCQ